MAIRHLTTEEFQNVVQESGKLAVVDFFANWCGPCKMLSPVLEQVAAEHEEVEFYKVNIDEEGALAERFGVMTIPTLLFMKDGKVVNKSVGLVPKKELENHINRSL